MASKTDLPIKAVKVDLIRRVPPNVRFEVDDVEADWTYSQPFDFIHCRTLYGAIKDWPRLVKQIFEYVEL